jgi:hypothetical protein
VGIPITVLADARFTDDDCALIASRRRGFRCSVCGHAWVIGPEPVGPTSAVCDFCGDEEPVSAFPCRDFVLDSAPGLSDLCTGPWAACQGCTELVRAADREGLVERSVLAFIRRFPGMASDMPPGHLTSDTRRRFNAFWRNRIAEEETR